MSTQDFINRQQDVDSEFVEIVDRNFAKLLDQPLTHEVVIPDQGNTGKLDPMRHPDPPKPQSAWERCMKLLETYPHEVIPDQGSTGKLDPKPCVYPNQPSTSSKDLKCPHCKKSL